MTREQPGSTGIVLFRKKPVVVEAVKWDGTSYPAVERFAGAAVVLEADLPGQQPGRLQVWNDQEQAWIPCPAGHWVVRGVLGEFYPVSPAAVEETYERAQLDAPETLKDQP